MFSHKLNIKWAFVLSAFVLFSISCMNSEQGEGSNSEKEDYTVEETIAKGLYEQVMEIGGEQLPKGQSGKWNKISEMIQELEHYSAEQGNNLKPRKSEVTAIFMKYGYGDYSEGYSAIEESSEKINYFLNIGLKIASLETIELTKGEKEARKTEKEIIKDLKKAGYTQSDIKGLDEYEETIGKSVSLLVKLPRPDSE